ncbi:hypothetical protein [Burkholderia sp. Bp9031]|uniref:hypothetical protein n=1 Tax=Burkholderia sp. Bp9031 TaxID=2184566 RepID=UPI0021AB6391|nr:hypothetical protein [Burkholderia sp. Bp9031]
MLDRVRIQQHDVAIVAAEHGWPRELVAKELRNRRQTIDDIGPHLRERVGNPIIQSSQQRAPRRRHLGAGRNLVRREPHAAGCPEALQRRCVRVCGRLEHRASLHNAGTHARYCPA